MLVTVKQHLLRTKTANLLDLATRFDVDPDLMRQMLQHWIRKGKVKLASLPIVCGASCQKCHPLVSEVYVWCGG